MRRPSVSLVRKKSDSSVESWRESAIPSGARISTVVFSLDLSATWQQNKVDYCTKTADFQENSRKKELFARRGKTINNYTTLILFAVALAASILDLSALMDNFRLALVSVSLGIFALSFSLSDSVSGMFSFIVSTAIKICK